MIKIIAFDFLGVLISNTLEPLNEKDIFKKVKEKYKNIKIIIATNCGSSMRNIINELYDTSYIDDLIISEEIHKMKPSKEFYQYILDKYNINADEMILLDDSVINTNSAKEMGIKTIKVENGMNLLDEIAKYLTF